MDEQQEIGEQERVPYPEDKRQANLDKLREVMGGEPPADMLELAHRREAEIAARRSHAA
ncbi:hypothetical protein [Nonomuraea africana]|uniref:DUF3072 domain-containing protein n=1 Tax=Nonomuraea africana TaxID=46171 RepID=A0ABR9KCP6_9ACTN|nr:hypothetical protein [Nonomuraea africana]MBE1559773.1 hypothetical protein [Nonomuraea africana]